MSSKPLATRRYRGSSAEDRRLKRRQRLLDAALRVYGTRGYRSTTVKAVCKAAGLTERYFYESFPNSEALFLALYKDVSVTALERIRIAGESAGEDPAAQARAMIGAYYANLPDSPACSRVYVIEAFNVSPAAKEVWKFWRRSLGDLFARAWSCGARKPLPSCERRSPARSSRSPSIGLRTAFPGRFSRSPTRRCRFPPYSRLRRQRLSNSPAGRRPPSYARSEACVPRPVAACGNLASGSRLKLTPPSYMTLHVVRWGAAVGPETFIRLLPTFSPTMNAKSPRVATWPGDGATAAR